VAPFASGRTPTGGGRRDERKEGDAIDVWSAHLAIRYAAARIVTV
jgi:hypothetical protein